MKTKYKVGQTVYWHNREKCHKGEVDGNAMTYQHIFDNYVKADGSPC